MKSLDRHQIDSLVRDLEREAYDRALAEVSVPASAESILLQAFADVAPYFTRSDITQLKKTLHKAIRSRASRLPAGHQMAAAAPAKRDESLHLRIVDVVEEQQSTDPVAPRRVVVGVLAGVVVIVALVTVGWTRFSALAAAQPMIVDTNLTASRGEVPAAGDFRFRFSRGPATKPTINLAPAIGTIDAVTWDGASLDASYSGLAVATKYTLTIEAEYRSRFNDSGHYLQRWSFTTQGYPVVTKVTPADGETLVFRNGELSIEFDHRPTVAPILAFMPNDATVESVTWIGSVWQVKYTGLLPTTQYRAVVTLDYGGGHPAIRHAWSFTTEPGGPPAGMPVIWYSMSNSGGISSQTLRLVALDWNGAVAGTLYGAGLVRQSPDGSMLAGEDGTFGDGQGKPLGRFRSYPPLFSDGGRSTCQLAPEPAFASSGTLVLFSGPADGMLRRVGAVGQFGADFGSALLACSTLADRVVVMNSRINGVSSVKVLALSSGRLLYQRSYALGPRLNVSSSRDGRYLAESTTNDPSVPASSNSAVIRRTSDGAIVARLKDQRVVQFSWDGQRVVTAPAYGSSQRNEIDLVDWQSGKVLWRLPGTSGTDGSQPVAAMAQPNGTKMVVAVATVPQTSDVDQLWLVDANGAAEQVLNLTFYPLFRWGE